MVIYQYVGVTSRNFNAKSPFFWPWGRGVAHGGDQMGPKWLISHLIIKNVQIEPRMSLALCLKAKICKKGKLVMNMEEGSWGRPWSAPNRAKMAKYKFFIKNQEKRQKLPWHFLRIYIYQKSQ